MAGFNMSSDLQRPEHNIPVGTLAAVCTSYVSVVTTNTYYIEVFQTCSSSFFFCWGFKKHYTISSLFPHQSQHAMKHLDLVTSFPIFSAMCDLPSNWWKTAGGIVGHYRWFLYLIFVFLLGAICTSEALRYDFLIAEKVNSLRLSSRPPYKRAAPFL